MSAFLGIALGLGCALTFAYLAARISVLIWNDSIAKAVTDYAVRKRLREVCENARFTDSDERLATVINKGE
jgi:hypothetical protein